MKYLVVLLFPVFLSLCNRTYFFPDQYNPGLSRFTSRDYNVASVYLNDSAWVSQSFRTYIYLDTVNNSTTDTLTFGWVGYLKNNNTPEHIWQQYQTLFFSFPVKKNFTRNDFLNWNGKQFPDGTTNACISLNPSPYQINNTSNVIGAGKVYFVKVSSQSNNNISISGLFEGNIGDSIIFKKGRFDFFIDSVRIPFH